MYPPQALHVTIVRDTASKPLIKQLIQRLESIVKGEISSDEPIRFEPSSGSTGSMPMDQITTELVKPRLFSNRVFDCLRSNGFTGWSTFPVSVTNRDGLEVLGYAGLVVTGRCGPIDHSKSIRGFRPERPDWACMMGMYFDPKSWDGTSIFTPNGGHVFVVNEVKEALEGIGVTNIGFTRLDQMENQLATLEMRRSNK
jgi:hypothetical protein